jgi:hypothetical protein
MAEQSFLGSNINRVKEHNLRTILRSLLYEGSLSRIQLAQKTGLSATAITNRSTNCLNRILSPIIPDGGPVCRCGKQGCLEPIICLG